MRCLQNDMRKSRIPLPDVLQSIVLEFLMHDLLPISQTPIEPKVVMVYDNDIYCQVHRCLYKNNVLVTSELEDDYCFIHPIDEKWIIVNGSVWETMMNAWKTPKFRLSFHAHGACAMNGQIFFLQGGGVWMRDSIWSSPRRLASTYGVSKLHVIGNCVTFAYPDDRCKLHDDHRVFTNCVALYRWNRVIYKINHKYIDDEHNNRIFRFPYGCLLDTFARNEYLFVVFEEHCFVCNLDNHCMMDVGKMDLKCSGNRIWSHVDGILTIF